LKEEFTRAEEVCSRIMDEVSRVVVGKKELIENILVSFIAGGHVLLEGVPGVAKTLIAKAIASALGCKFSRIQFTPDLLPSDITGTYIYRAQTSEFVLRKGPVFANVVLADEINRAPPKTQSALLECMQEGQATIEGETHIIEPPFIVIATQNPVELEGTYPLPEAQIDRFLMRLVVGYPSKDEEVGILKLWGGKDNMEAVESVTSREELIKLQDIAKRVHCEDRVLEYIVDLVSHTRRNPSVLLGASPRASLSLLAAAKAKALLSGRDYVIPDDIKTLAPHVLNHRVLLRPEAELDGMKPEDVIKAALNSVRVR